MARPSIKAQRAEEILDAYELCVVRYGVEGSTLERVAEQAGLARPLIRHHVGNRDDLLEALADRFFKKSQTYLDELVAQLPDEKKAIHLINWLFSEKYSDRTMVLIAEALIAASQGRPNLSVGLKSWIDSYIKVFAQILRDENKDVTAKTARIVATGIVGIWFNVDSLLHLDNRNKIRRDSWNAALRLIATLKLNE
jgi:AcrR family transcriptional regulator